MTKEKKKQVKERILKVVHVVCYILSALFIGLMLLTGLQSCKSATGLSAEVISGTNDLRYQYKYSGAYEMSLDIQQTISDGDIDINEPAPYSTSHIELLNYDVTGYISINGTLHEVNGYQLEYGVYWYGGTDENYYRLNAISFNYNNSYYEITFKTETDEELGSTDNGYYAYNNVIFVTDQAITSVMINTLFENTSDSNFVFNKAFNYNAPYSINVDNDYINKGTLMVGWEDIYISAYVRGKYMDLPYFVSNGQIFNRVVWCAEWDTTQGTGNVVLYATSSTDYYEIPEGKELYTELRYVNTETNSVVVVNVRNTYTGYSDVFGLPYNAYTDGSTWINDGYRYITFIGNLSTQQQVNIMAFNNNNQNAYSGGIYNSDTNNVFTLVASAFTGIIPILSVYILPGITLGTLLFVPLVATLVFVIIKIIKK